MNTSNRICIALPLLLVFGSALRAQVPTWQQNVQVQVSDPVYALTSDGYGQHILTYGSGGLFEHYLIGNDGEVISANSGNIHPTFITEFSASITNSSGIVSVVFDTVGNKLILHQSTNGGASWTRKGAYTPTGHTVHNIDAFAEKRSGVDMVHIVWDSDAGDTVYYIRYEGNAINAFSQFQTITNIGGITGRKPKVITSSDRIHVSLVATTTAENKRGYMRDFVFSTGQWESDYRRTNTIALVHPIMQENVGVRNNGTTDSLHLTMQEDAQSSGYTIRLSRRRADSDWLTPENQDWVTNSSDQSANYRRTVASVGDTLYTVFNRNSSSNGGIKWSEYKAASGWSSLRDIATQSGNDELRGKVTITASRTGVYTVWETHTLGEVYMARKVLSLSGSIAENMFWTDSNWVSGDLNIASGVTVRAKAGSVTTVLANKNLTVNGGATLIVEDGATITLGSGSSIVAETTSTIVFENNVIFTIPAGAALVANEGALIKFGSGAGLLVNGTLTADGASGNNVVFTRTGTSGTWGGIVVDNCNASTPVTLTYASLSHCGTGISTRLSAKFGMDHCTLDDMEIGLEIDPTQGDCPTSGPAIQVTNSTFTNITATGILVNSFSNLTLQGNTLFGPESSPYPAPAGITCINASPKLLGNTIKDFPIGLECLSGSAPVLEDGIYGGYNVITENGVGVLCQDGSNAVLGFLSGNMNDVGGMNSIAKNTGYDVSLINGCSASGENNWWGLDDDPPGIFDIDEGSKLDYDPWLDSDPNGDSPINVGRQSASNDDPMMDPMPAIARRALANMGDGHYTEAIQLLRTIFTDSTYESSVRKWATRMLLVASQHQATPSLAGYLHASLTTYPALARTIRSVLPFSYLNERTHGEAMASFEVNLEQYPGSELARAALYGKFINALFVDHDLGSASRLQTQLESGFPSSTEASLAAIQLRCNQPPGSNTSPIGNGKAMEKQLTGSLQLPREFMLGQNYPNPFNPSTTIQYSIPKDAHVSLAIHDVLGRAVATLESGVKSAGSYTINFDASSLASGVYIYRLQADGLTMVRKMLVVK